MDELSEAIGRTLPAPFQSIPKADKLTVPIHGCQGDAMLSEFKAFIARGNVLDLAVAVIIGAAFATITTSLTGDIIMPAVGAIFGGLDFANHFTILGPLPDGFVGDPASYKDLKAAGVPVLGWGQFLTVVINFLILAFVIFMLVRYATKLMKRADEPPAGPTEVELLTEIRDELKRR
jgi:large conductance mechanosensitive channel